MKIMLVYLLVLLLFVGCATTIPQPSQQELVDAQAEMLRFEQAKALSASDIPDIYNVSRLSRGSNVKIKHTQNNLDKAYFTTKTLGDIKADDKGKAYIIDSVVEGKTYTFSEDAVSLSKIVSPYENIQPLADVKGLPQGDNVSIAIAKGAITGGLVGAVMGAWDSSRMNEINSEVAEHIKGMRIETKVIEFKLISNETLKVAGKDILCKVYQIHSLIRQTHPPAKKISSPSFIIDKSGQMWVSEDVPFGVVKSESTQILYMCMDANSRYHSTIDPKSRITHESNEVVEFSY